MFITSTCITIFKMSNNLAMTTLLQNHQDECAPAKDSDHPFLIRIGCFQQLVDSEKKLDSADG